MLLLDDFGRDGAVAIFRKAIEVETGYNPNFLPSEHLGQWVTGRTGDKHGLRLNTAGRMQAGIVREAARRGISSQELARSHGALPDGRRGRLGPVQLEGRRAET